MLLLGRECPTMPCTAVLADEEWQSVYVMVTQKQLPRRVPTLAEMIERIAHLGGYRGRKPDGPPGPQVMGIGLQRMRDFSAAWITFGPIQTATRVVSNDEAGGPG